MEEEVLIDLEIGLNANFNDENFQEIMNLLENWKALSTYTPTYSLEHMKICVLKTMNVLKKQPKSLLPL